MLSKLIKFFLNLLPREFIQRIVGFITPVLAVFYRGDKVKCSICDSHYREFLPYGYVVSRPNSLCPKCLSLERHRMMWLYLKNETSFFSLTNKNILHIAPEHCYIKRFTKIFGENYITADLSSPLAKVKMDVQAIPFNDETFDIIFCNHILEHVTDDKLAMSELYRVMRKGGWGIMLSPVNFERQTTYEDSSITSPHERAKAFGQKDHLRDYGTDYPQRLEQAGFKVECIDYTSGKDKSLALGCDILYKVSK